MTAPTSANAHVAASTEKFEAGVNYYTCDSSGRYTKAAVTAGTEIPKNPVYYVATDPVTFTVSPDKGYTVDKIEIKFLLKGSDTYKTYEWTQGSARGIVSNGSGSFSFVMPEADVTITVTFKEGTGEGGSDSTTEPNIDDLITEAGDSAQEDDEEIMREDSTKDVFETIGVKYRCDYVKTEDQHFHPDSTYYIKGDDGKYTRAQVTADAEVGTDKDYYQRTGAIMLEVSKVDAGRKIEVFVNPASGKVVKSVTATYKTLFVPAGGQYEANETYYLLIDGDYVKQTITKFEDMDSSKTYYVIDQDNPREVTETIEKTNGKYIYTIPYGTKNGAMAGDNSLFFSILITAEFGDPDPTATGSEESAGTEAQTAQSAGALAAGVNINTNNARITTTGKIKAGGTVTVSANASAIATIQADGTAVGPDAASSEPEKEDQPEAGAVTAAQDIIPYTVYIEPAHGVALTQVGGTDAAKGIFVFQALSLDPAFENGEGKVTFTYTKADGTAGTGTAAYDGDKDRYTVDLSALDIKSGTQVSVKVASLASGMPIEGEYLVSNTLTVHSTQNGTVVHASGAPGSNTFAFKITPAVGYRLKAKQNEGDQGWPYIQFTKVTKNGDTVTEEEAKFTLNTDGKGNYYFSFSDKVDGEKTLKDVIKPGSKILLFAEFEENILGIKTEFQTAGTPIAEGQTVPGSIAVTEGGETAGPEDLRPREGKKVTVKLTANDPGQYAKVYVSYTLDGTAIKKELEDEGESKYSFTMPNAEVTIIADFFKQAHTLTVTNQTGDPITDANLSATSGAVGQEIIISLTEEAVKAGKKITTVHVSFKHEGMLEAITLNNAAMNSAGAWRYRLPNEVTQGSEVYYLEGTDSAPMTITFIPVIVQKGHDGQGRLSGQRIGHPLQRLRGCGRGVLLHRRAEQRLQGEQHLRDDHLRG